MLEICTSGMKTLRFFDLDKVKVLVNCNGSIPADIKKQIEARNIKIINCYSLANGFDRTSDYPEVSEIFKEITEQEGQIVFQCDLGRSRSVSMARAFASYLGQAEIKRYTEWDDKVNFIGFPTISSHEESYSLSGFYLKYFEHLKTKGLIPERILFKKRVEIKEAGEDWPGMFVINNEDGEFLIGGFYQRTEACEWAELRSLEIIT